MSIYVELKARIAEGRLVQVTPILGGAQARIVYATPEVFTQLEPSTADADFAASSGHLRRWLDGFTNGKQLVVGPRRSRTCDMKRLDPQRDEVWEIRKQDQPSIRLFGRFVEKDVFVVTNMELVTALFSMEWFVKGASTWPIWKREIRNCKASWRRLFHTYQPHSGSNLNDYLSAAVAEGAF
jgi:hypothetical protein